VGQTITCSKSIGQVKCTVGSETLTIDNVRYVPGLAESIYNLFLYIKQKHHGVQSSLEDGLHLKFPTFTKKAIVAHDDINLDALPLPDNSTTFDLNSSMTTSQFIVPHCCCLITQQDKIMMDSKQQDNLLKTLHQYHSEVKTKHQLNLDVPVSFRPSSNLQKDFNFFTPPCKA